MSPPSTLQLIAFSTPMSTAVLVFSAGVQTAGREKLLNGTDSKKRFGYILRELERILSEAEIQVLACLAQGKGPVLTVLDKLLARRQLQYFYG